MERRKTGITGDETTLSKKLEKQGTRQANNEVEPAKEKDKENIEVKTKLKINTEEIKEILNGKKKRAGENRIQKLATLNLSAIPGKETESKKESKANWKIATWNVRGLGGKEQELIENLENTNIEIVAITETKKKGKGNQILQNGDLLVYSGVEEKERAKAGVACLIKQSKIPEIRKWKSINERILTLEVGKGKSLRTIVVVYGPDENESKNEKDKFWYILQETYENKRGKLIMAGDFNARVGKDADKWKGVIGKHGEDKQNNNGTRLLEFCVDNNLLIMNTIFQHKEIHKYTREMKSRGEKSIIDYIIIEQENKKDLKDCKVRRGYEIGSDHYLLLAKIKKNELIRCEKKVDNIQKEKIRAYKLRNPEIREKYQKEVTEQIAKRQSIVNDDINESWNTFKELLLRSAKNICGSNKTSNYKKRTAWWNEEIRKEVKEKKKLWKRYLQSKDATDYQNYKSQRTVVKEKIWKAKECSWEEFGKQMEINSKENQKMFYRAIKNFQKKPEYILQQIKTKNKEILVEGNQIINRWKEYFEELLNADKGTKIVNEETKLVMENRETVNSIDITREEIEEAINRIKNAKASGVDEVAPEMVKYIGERGKEELRKLINLCWMKKRIPDEWKTGVILPIYKKGDTKECDNYRGITLLCTTLKLYERVLEKRLRQIVGKQLEDIQSGFRPNRSIQDHIFTVQQVIEKKITKDKDIYVCFVDMKKAFDTISRTKIWDSLKNKKVDNHLIQAIKSLYHKTENKVRTCNRLSESFNTTEGVRQGSVLSPLLFICAMDEAVKESQPKMEKFVIGYKNLQPIRIETCVFADDILIFANSENNLEKNVNAWKTSLDKLNLNLNIGKTKCMAVSNRERESKITVEGNNIEQVSKYKYLGTTINSKGNLDDELNERIQTANRVYYSLQKKFLGHKQISQTTKISVYKTVYLPILLHGGENWVLTEKQERRLQAIEMKYHRKVLGVCRMDKRRNEDIRKELGIKSVKQILEEKKLRWFGHIVRMEEGRQVKKSWEARPLGKNKRGRPKQKWDSSVVNILNKKGKDWTSAQALARDRKKWKKFIDEKETSTP